MFMFYICEQKLKKINNFAGSLQDLLVKGMKGMMSTNESVNYI